MKLPWKKIIYFFTIILLILACKETNAKMNENRSELPKTAYAWQISGQPKLVTASNIFEYMNGAGELYLAYRFKKLEVYEYKAVDKEKILAEIYLMETPDDAFGLLSQDWEGEPVELKPSSAIENKRLRALRSRTLYGSGLLRIASGKIYARILTLVETPESKEAVLSIGRAVMEDEGEPYEPTILHALPEKVANEWKLQRNEIRYFRSNLILNSFYFLSFKNILNFEHSSEAVTAVYESKARPEKNNSIRVLFVKYEDSEKANQALNAFCKTYLPEHGETKSNHDVSASSGYFQVEDGWLGYELKDDFLSFVFQCPDEKSARSVISALTLNVTETGGGYAK
ncbi:DUF6599 family protein [Thermodesulfobacteriota bacterium]